MATLQLRQRQLLHEKGALEAQCARLRTQVLDTDKPATADMAAQTTDAAPTEGSVEAGVQTATPEVTARDMTTSPEEGALRQPDSALEQQYLPLKQAIADLQQGGISGGEQGTPVEQGTSVEQTPTANHGTFEGEQGAPLALPAASTDSKASSPDEQTAVTFQLGRRASTPTVEVPGEDSPQAESPTFSILAPTYAWCFEHMIHDHVLALYSSNSICIKWHHRRHCVDGFCHISNRDSRLL